jgi:parvulin-like peptidyl-prolyl isomerase
MALSAKTQVTDAELQELYLKTYPRKTVYEVSHILLSVDKGATDEEEAAVKEKATDILAEIKNGTPFEAMASKYSEDSSSADKGGLLGTFNEGQLLPELEQLVSTLEPGESGGPVRTAAGFHILKLISRQFSEPPPLAEVRSSLERHLMFQKEESVRDKWIKELKETTYIEVFPDDG